MTPEYNLAIGNFMSDFFKQMITLNTGMIVLIFTLVEKVLTPEKVFKSRGNRLLLIASLFFLLASLLTSIQALVTITSNLVNVLQAGNSNININTAPLLRNIYLFFGGVFLFITLALRTILQTPSHNLKSGDTL